MSKTEETLFLYRAEGSEPAEHQTLIQVPGRLNLHVVAVPGQESACQTARRYLDDHRLEMIELFGGFSLAQVAFLQAQLRGDWYLGTTLLNAGRRPSGRAGLIAILEHSDPERFRSTIRLPAGDLEICIVESFQQAGEVAKGIVARGAVRIELCGGFGFTGAALVQSCVPDAFVDAVFFPYHPLLGFKTAESHFH